jgi:phospholipid/cholesterol/gamma-HCH transport system substrate-binding protein
MKAAGSTLEPPRDSVESRVREQDLLTALPARSANREVKVGAFVLTGLLAFFVALFSLTDVGTFRGRYYATTIIENAGGMRNGDPVQMRGVNVGRVSSFNMVPDGVAVRLEIYNRYAIPEDSRVLVRSAGLLGGMVVDVVPGDSPNRVSEDAILAGEVQTDIMTTAAGLGGEAETVLARANLLLSESTIGSVSASAAEFQAMLADFRALVAIQQEELALLSQSLRRSAEGVERVTSGVERVTSGPGLERAVANIDSLTYLLGETTQTLGAASASLESVLGRIDRGEGTLGRLISDETMYDNFNAAAVSLQELVTDIRADPRRYLNVSVF